MSNTYLDSRMILVFFHFLSDFCFSCVCVLNSLKLYVKRINEQIWTQRNNDRFRIPRVYVFGVLLHEEINKRRIRAPEKRQYIYKH